MKFVVFGDLHYCTPEGRPPAEAIRKTFARLPDYPRYAAMEHSVRQPLFSMAKKEKPELLISTGDLIEGGADSERDLAEANARLAEIAPEIHRAPGSHDLFPPRRKEYASCRKDGNLFLFLDYTDWGDAQREWLIRELENGKDAGHVFVFGHAPLYLFARHFFHSAGYADDVAEILNRYPVDIYFCGHTHNQTVSRHGTMLQITGSSIGYPEAPAIPLEQFHALAPSGPSTRFYWGFPEDYQPGFWTVETHGEALRLNWSALHNSAELYIAGRFAEPEIRPPRMEPYSSELRDSDLYQLHSAWLNIFSANKGENDSELLFNGISLGAIPANACYAARRFLQLPPEALATIHRTNTLEIRFPHSSAFGIGSISLDLLLLDGRRIRSSVSPELFVHGDDSDYRYAIRYAAHAVPGGNAVLSVRFPTQGE